MRKAATPLGLAVGAGVAGLASAALHMKPSVAVIAGLFLVAGVAAFYLVGTDKLAMYAVGLFVFTITWNGIRLGGGSSTGTAGGGAFGDATMVLAAAGVIAYVVSHKRPMALPPWLLAAGLLCLLSALLTTIFPPGVATMQRSLVAAATLAQQDGVTGPIALASNTLTLIEYELALLVIPVLIAAVGTTPPRCRLLMDLWAAGAIINGIVGVLGLAGLHIASSAAIQNRSAGLTIQPNYLALTCVLALPMTMLWFGRSRRYTIAGVIGVASLLGGVYASGSRAGTVAAVLAIIVTIAAVPRLRPRLLYVLPVTGMALVIILAFTPTGHKILQQLRLSGGGSTTSGSNYQRSLVANVAWAQIKVRPLEGVGWGVVTGAHDIYLELLDAGGVIALVAFFAFIGGMVASLRRALSGPLRDEAVVCGIAILAWLANGVFDNQVADKYLYVVPGLLFAIAHTTRMLETRPTAPVVAIEPRARPAPARALVGAGAP